MFSLLFYGFFSSFNVVFKVQPPRTHGQKPSRTMYRVT